MSKVEDSRAAGKVCICVMNSKMIANPLVDDHAAFTGVQAAIPAKPAVSIHGLKTYIQAMKFNCLKECVALIKQLNYHLQEY